MKQLIKKFLFLLAIAWLVLLSSAFNDSAVVVYSADDALPGHSLFARSRILHDAYFRSESNGITFGIQPNHSRINFKNQLNHFSPGLANIVKDKNLHSLFVYIAQEQPLVALSKCRLIFPFHYFW